MALNEDHATTVVADRPQDDAVPTSPQAQATGRHPGVLVGPVPRLDPRPRDLAALGRWLTVDPRAWMGRVASPLGALAIAALLIVGVSGYGLGAAARSGGGSVPAVSADQTASGSGMSTGGSGATTAAPSSVPDATQQYGDQPATFTTDPDGAKHFTFTAEQVMWSPLKGARVLAWTLGGTVPGPQIRVTVGDRLRITVINRLPKATALHWHGLEVPSDQDGVPGVGMQPIQPGQTYTYDFSVGDQDVGTHWYHSHYDDLEQVGGGLYGAFLVDPRPGSAQAQQAIQADVTYDEFIGELGGYFVLNGKSFPDTQPIAVAHGQTVHVRLFGASVDLIHPMHLHGHVFNIVAEDGHLLAQPIQKDTVQVAPGETYDLTFYAWAAPGSVYPFHCHILTHLMNPGQTGDEMGGLIALIEYAK